MTIKTSGRVLIVRLNGLWNFGRGRSALPLVIADDQQREGIDESLPV